MLVLNATQITDAAAVHGRSTVVLVCFCELRHQRRAKTFRTCQSRNYAVFATPWHLPTAGPHLLNRMPPYIVFAYSQGPLLKNTLQSERDCLRRERSRVLKNSCFRRERSRVVKNSCLRRERSRVVKNSCFRRKRSRVPTAIKPVFFL